MTNRPTVDNDFSSSLTSFFFHCSKSNEEGDFRKATQLYENMVGVNCRHTTHRTKRGTKGQTSQVIDMQLCRLSITWYRLGRRKRTLTFRSFISGFVALDFTGFARVPMFTMGRKVELVSFVIRFYGIIWQLRVFHYSEALDGVIDNSRFSNSKYSLFIFFESPLFIIHYSASTPEKIGVLAVLAYGNSFIHFKLLVMTIVYVFLLSVEETKWRKRNQSRVKEKPTTFFTKKTVFQNECNAKELHILTTLSSRCCKVLPFLNFSSRIFRLRFFF